MSQKNIDEFTYQIEGYTRCITLWLSSLGCYHPKVRDIAKHLISLFKDIPVEDLPKEFKLLLCTNFSRLMNQEIPIGGNKYLNSYPCPKIYMRYLFQEKSRKSRFYQGCWNLLQCKAVSNVVPKSFVQKAYEKHSKILSKVETTEPWILERYREFIKPYCEKVRSYYSDRSTEPKRKAYFGYSQKEGGLKKALYQDRIIKHSGFINPHMSELCPDIRMDPVVIHLEGQPASGKSTLIPNINKEIGQRFGYSCDNYREFVYERGSTVKHWDGYNHQLITLIDDFVQVPGSTSKPSDDAKELIHLTSPIDYVLPMADLRDKGRKFDSAFLVLSSNLGTIVGQKGLASEQAYLRRVANPVWKVSRKAGVLELVKQRVVENKYCNNRSLETEATYKFKNQFECARFLGHWAVNQFLERLSWSQQSHNDIIHHVVIPNDEDMSDLGRSLQFQVPRDLERNSVMTYGITEPLKVRMITKGQPLCHALKPVQKAMFRSLKDYKVFEPCYNPEIDQKHVTKNHKNGNFYVSGDYSSATDGLHFDFSQVFMEELSKSFEDLPSIQRLITWEGGSHEVHYPQESGLKPILQTNGQLMGSLLSFPALCLANAFTLAYARDSKTIEQENSLIHGDDIVFQSDEETFARWKYIAPLIGFELSVGKNYIHDQWFSIDSQMFFRASSRKLDTGKFKCFYKTKDSPTPDFRDAMSMKWMRIQTLKRFGIKGLEKTPRELRIPTSYGGLAPDKCKLIKGYSPTFQDQLIYWIDFHQKVKTKVIVNEFRNGKGLPRKIVQIPKLFGMALGFEEVNSPFEEDELDFLTNLEKDMKIEFYPWKKLKSAYKNYKNNNIHRTFNFPLVFSKVVKLDDLDNGFFKVKSWINEDLLRNFTENFLNNPEIQLSTIESLKVKYSSTLQLLQ